MKLAVMNVKPYLLCRSPCGERGLKSLTLLTRLRLWLSLPVRGAWIEMFVATGKPVTSLSLPVRGAWIEMRAVLKMPHKLAVAPRAGSVD